MLLSREVKDVNVDYADPSTLDSQSNIPSLDEEKPTITHSEVEGLMDHNTQFSLDEKHGPKPKISILIPQRNSSRCISIPFEGELGSDPPVSEDNEISQSTGLSKSPDPHERYLSGEDDVSNSDGNESFFDSDDSYTEIPMEATKKTPQEITAKAVSIRIAGKPQIIDINMNLASSAKPSVSLDRFPRSSDEAKPVHEKLAHPQLPAIIFTPTDLNFNNHYVFPSVNASPGTSESVPILPSCPSPGDAKVHKHTARSKSFSSTRSLTSSSVVTPGISSQGNHTTRSLLGAPVQMINTPPAETSKLSSKFAALKRASKNIRNTSISRINLSHTPGVIQCRHAKQPSKSPHVRLIADSDASDRPFTP